MSTFSLPDSMRPKASHWLRALHRRTLDAWLATVEDLGAFAVEAAFAVIAVRVLDDAVFARSGRDDYLDYRKTSVEGQVVAGLELVRNAELHSAAITEHDNSRLVGVSDDALRRFPRWKSYKSLPPEYLFREDGVTSRASRECQHAYKKEVEDRLVMETLLDAVAFFHRADPAIVPSDSEGVSPYFPLPDLACRPDERRSPDWPSADRWHKSEAKRLRRRVPLAASREVTVRLVDQDRVVGYGGWTVEVNGRRDSWVERAPQVARDVRAGYPYVIRVGGASITVQATDAMSVYALRPGGSDALLELPMGIDPPLNLDHLKFLEAEPNSDLYRQMRLAAFG